MGSTISSIGTSVGGKRKHSECEDSEDGSQTEEEAVVDVVKRSVVNSTKSLNFNKPG